MVERQLGRVHSQKKRRQTPEPEKKNDSGILEKADDNDLNDSKEKPEDWHDLEAKLVSEIPMNKDIAWESKQKKHINFAEKKFAMYQRQCLNVNRNYLFKWKQPKDFSAKETISACAKPVYYF